MEDARSAAIPAISVSENDGTKNDFLLEPLQEHYLKKALMEIEVDREMNILGSPTGLELLGPPFRSNDPDGQQNNLVKHKKSRKLRSKLSLHKDSSEGHFHRHSPRQQQQPLERSGSISSNLSSTSTQSSLNSPSNDTTLPILSFMFHRFVLTFPFITATTNDSFWQEKVQVFVESFLSRGISSSEDREEQSKRQKIAFKLKKLVEILMTSSVKTSSGLEEKLALEASQEQQHTLALPESEPEIMAQTAKDVYIHGYSVHIVGVHVTETTSSIGLGKKQQHTDFIIRTKRKGEPDVYVARTYTQFKSLATQLARAFPGKGAPHLPPRDKRDKVTRHTFLFENKNSETPLDATKESESGTASPADNHETHPRRVIRQERQRASLQTFLREYLLMADIASSPIMGGFLLNDPLKGLSPEEELDMKYREELDQVRTWERLEFYRVASERTRELDVYMKGFRNDLIQHNGLMKLFSNIKRADTLKDLPPQYRKFVEWARIEVATVLYNLFVGGDHSDELFAQAKRLHHMLPYTIVKNILRFSNPMSTMKALLDLFMARPFGARSLLERIMGAILSDEIAAHQKKIDDIRQMVDLPAVSDRIREYVDSDEATRNDIKQQAEKDKTHLIVTLVEVNTLHSPVDFDTIDKLFDLWTAWEATVSSDDNSQMAKARKFSHLLTLLKLEFRRRDKDQMLELLAEPTTMQFFRDVLTIFYSPLAQVYRSARIYNSVNDFAAFAADLIQLVDVAESQDEDMNPNQLVQAFVDLCQRHEEAFYKFVHEVYTHDQGLFTDLLKWIDSILAFLRQGPDATLDIQKLFKEATTQSSSGLGASRFPEEFSNRAHGGEEVPPVDAAKLKYEIDSLIRWKSERKSWALRRRRMAMMQDRTSKRNHGDSGASNGASSDIALDGNNGAGFLAASDFGLNELDIEDLEMDESALSDSDISDSEGGSVKNEANGGSHSQKLSEDRMRQLYADKEDLQDAILSERRRRKRSIKHSAHIEKLRRLEEKREKEALSSHDDPELPLEKTMSYASTSSSPISLFHEPIKPTITEIAKLQPRFSAMLQDVLHS